MAKPAVEEAIIERAAAQASLGLCGTLSVHMQGGDLFFCKSLDIAHARPSTGHKPYTSQHPTTVHKNNTSQKSYGQGWKETLIGHPFFTRLKEAVVILIQKRVAIHHQQGNQKLIGKQYFVLII